MVLTIYAANQSQIQRYLSCKDLRTAQLCAPLSSIFGNRLSSVLESVCWTRPMNAVCVRAQFALVQYARGARHPVHVGVARNGRLRLLLLLRPASRQTHQCPDQVLTVLTLAFLRSPYLFIIFNQSTY